MIELRDALTQISEIRQQMARSQVFRGYRSATTGFSAAMAVVAALVQWRWIPDPVHQMRDYLRLWFAAAVVSLIVVAIEMVVRYRRTESLLQRELTLHAVEQFVPCLFAGAMLTFVMQRVAPETLWMLPGLWAVLFALGCFASRRVLPRQVVWVARFYLLGGLVCLSRADRRFSPWGMALTFGGGQFLAAVILYWKLERTHVQA